MRVIVGESVFLSSRVRATTLSALFRFGWQRRHRTLIKPQRQDGFQRWLAARGDQRLQQEIVEAIDTSLVADSTEPPLDLTIGVEDVAEITPGDRYLIVPPEVAVSLLGEKLAVCLENGIHDRNFLLSIVVDPPPDGSAAFGAYALSQSAEVIEMSRLRGHHRPLDRAAHRIRSLDERQRTLSHSRSRATSEPTDRCPVRVL